MRLPTSATTRRASQEPPPLMRRSWSLLNPSSSGELLNPSGFRRQFRSSPPPPLLASQGLSARMLSVRSMVTAFRGALPRVAGQIDQCRAIARHGASLSGMQVSRSMITSLRAAPVMAAGGMRAGAGLSGASLSFALRPPASLLLGSAAALGGVGSMQVRGMRHGKLRLRMGLPVKHRCSSAPMIPTDRVHGTGRTCSGMGSDGVCGDAGRTCCATWLRISSSTSASGQQLARPKW